MEIGDHLKFAIGTIVYRKRLFDYEKCMVVGYTKSSKCGVFGDIMFVDVVNINDGMLFCTLPASLSYA